MLDDTLSADSEDFAARYRPVWKVGDRVRVKLSAECEYCVEDREYNLDGITGTIYEIGPKFPNYDDGNSTTHIIWVDFDEPVEGYGPLAHYTPTELVAITDDDR